MKPNEEREEKEGFLRLIEQLEEQNTSLRSALEFYATSEHYATGQWVGDVDSRVQRDRGQRAKIALNTKL